MIDVSVSFEILISIQMILSKHLRRYVAETFLATRYIQEETTKESSFWSDITANPDAPAMIYHFEE